MPDNYYDVVSIQNIDDEDFTFEYDRSKGNYPYTIRAGEVKRYPRFLASHAVKHLINKILTKREQKTNNLPLRQQLAEQIIIQEESYQDKPVKSQADLLKERVENLNRPSELDAILARRHKIDKEAQSDIKPEPVTPKIKEPPEEFAGLEKKKEEPAKEESKADEGEKKDEDQLALPTREELYDFAVNKMNMEMTPKTRKSLDAMNVPQLVKELNYPLLGE